jgi:hypothetical protein
MCYQRVKNVAWRRVGGETVIINLGRRRMLAVNEAGGAVWETLVKGTPVSPGEAALFLADLEAEGVVERLAADPPGAALAAPPGGTPAVVWREELNHFGGCSFIAGQSDLCNQNPGMS